MSKIKVSSINKLAEQKSPYLIQHAKNPVNWYPWNEEAFKDAKNNDKPIFLSIGYSTCHWCHVMAHESFEDQEVAKLINKVFIPIKVDREERPDIDNVYMTVCQMMTGIGGWPLTIFMTPDKKPFYATTYIPKKSRYGRLGLLELLPKIEEQWNTNKDQLENNANRINDLLKQDEKEIDDSKTINLNIFNEAYSELKQKFDSVYGGFGQAPKFPMPHQNLFLLNYYIQKNKDNALKIVEKNLKQMKAGGIYDHIGYGFHRYSTDEKWLLPHFEKMLYDQALLIYLYTTAYQITGNDIYKTTIHEVIEYIENKMLAEEGGFYSAEDADSEEVEGKFYVWELDEIKNILQEKSKSIVDLYNIKKMGNYYDESTAEKTAENILHLNLNDQHKRIDFFEKEKELINERRELNRAREKRIHPHKDDKILTDWNGLMIAALAKAAFILKENKYLKLAEDGANFIIDNLINKNTLLHRYRDGEAAIRGTLEDYSFFIWGLLELYQITFKTKYLNLSIELNNYILENFWDNEKGGFFFVSSKDKELIFRNKEVYDGAIPSGNSIALCNLLRLSHLTGDQELEEKANDMVKTFSQKVSVAPTAYCQFLIGLQKLFLPYYDIIIVGRKDDSVTKDVLTIIRENYTFNLSVILIPADRTSQEYKELKKRISFIKNYKQIQNKTTMYICKDYSCNLPVTDVDEVVEILNS